MTAIIAARFKRTDTSHKDCFGDESFRFRATFGRVIGWRITGELQEAAEAIQTDIANYLAEKQLCWKSYRPRNDPNPLQEPTYVVECRLLGRDKLHASPHVIIATEHKWAANRLRQIILDSNILRGSQRWGCCKLPAGVRLTSPNISQIAHLPSNLPLAISGDFEVCIPGNRVPWNINRRLVDIWQNSCYIGSSTVGGLLDVGERTLALSVAHSFLHRPHPPAVDFDPEEIVFDESELEFLLPDQSSEGGDDINSIDARHNDDINHMDVHDDDDDPIDEYCDDIDPIDIPDEDADPVTLRDDENVEPPSPSSHPTNSRLNHERSGSSSRVSIGSLDRISNRHNREVYERIGLDWALVAITHPGIVMRNRYRLQNALLDNRATENDIIIVTPKAELKAELVSTAVLGVSLNAVPQTVLVAVLVGDAHSVREGDSGSWAFRRKDGEPTGMLIGNCMPLNQYYLLDMNNILSDIKEQTGFPAKIAQTTTEPWISTSETIVHGALENFKARLTEVQRQSFASRGLRDLQRRILMIQHDQHTQRTMIDFARMGLYLDKFASFEDVCYEADIGGNVTSEMSSYIWGPSMYIIEVAHDTPVILDRFLELHQEFGTRTPDLSKYVPLIRKNPQMLKCLAFMYCDLIDFLGRAMALVTGREWKKTFDANWKESEAHFEVLLTTFDCHERVLRGMLGASNEQVSLDAARRLNKHISQYTDDTITIFERLDANEQASKTATQQITEHIAHCQDTSQTILDSLQELLANYERDRENVQRRAREEDAKRKTEQKKAVLAWISTPGASQAEYHKKSTDLWETYPNTAKWILDHYAIKSWMTDEVPCEPIVWLNGKKGSGKTTLASLIIESCKEIEGFHTSYFYCREDDQARNTGQAAFKAILRQMVEYIDELLPYCHDRQSKAEQELNYERDGDPLLKLYCSQNRKHFIVIDGLDECAVNERKSICEFWKDMVDRCENHFEPGRIRVLFVSQDVPDIRNWMETSQLGDIVDLNTADTREDIRKYVQTRAAELQRQFPLTQAELDTLQVLVCERAEDMFLFAFLAIENLQAQPNIAKLKDELKENNFPKNLAEAYGKIITRLKMSQHLNAWLEAKRIFSLLVSAKRPLKLHELQGALCINTERYGIDEVDFHNRQLRKDVREICGSLIHVVGNSRIEFTHGSTRSHLIKTEDLDEKITEFDLTITILRYLTFNCFDPSLSKDDCKYYTRGGYYVFQDYAASKWMHHVRRLLELTPHLFDDGERGKYYEDTLARTMDDFCEFYEDSWSATRPHWEEEPSGSAASSVGSLSVRSTSAMSTGATPPNTSLSNSSLLPPSIPTSSLEIEALCQPFAHRRFYPALLKICSHINNYDNLEFKDRNKISLKKLEVSILNSRKMIEDLGSSTRETEVRERYGNRLHKCPRLLCPYFYEGLESDAKLKHHLKRHDRPFQCPIPSCSTGVFGFLSNKDRDRHVRNTHPDITKDQLNPFESPVKRTMKEEAKYKCKLCPRSFTRKANLVAHSDNHTGRKAHRCLTCGKAFTRANDKRRHENSIHVRRSGV